MFAQNKLPLDAERAFLRYEAIRDRLPTARFPGKSDRTHRLADLADAFDVFVLDAFGVLNVGANPIPGAPQTINALQETGKRIFVLTNGASFPPDVPLARYLSWGYRLAAEQVITSREAAVAALADRPAGTRWGVAATEQSAVETLAPNARTLGDNRSDYDEAQAFLLLSSIGWTVHRHRELVDSLSHLPRPVVVANPDIIAPHEDGFSLEPGFYAHDLTDRTGIVPVFHGKPFASVFDIVRSRLPEGTDASRVAMVGDTLHTDILGGAAAGWKTVLVAGHGLFRGHDVRGYIERSSLTPDYVVETI